MNVRSHSSILVTISAWHSPLRSSRRSGISYGKLTLRSVRDVTSSIDALQISNSDTTEMGRLS